VNTLSKLPILAVAGLGLLAAACGGSPAASSGSGGSAPAAASSAPASSGSGSDYGSGYGSSSGSSAPAASGSVVKAGSVTVDGKPETVLADAKGLTLYYFVPDKGGKVTCTGACAQAWPPLKLTAGAATSQAPTGVSGTLGTVSSPDGGAQLTFNGWPAYTFAGDSGPGQANGHGVNGKWFEITSSTPQA
jgi:predicted lipoprotein with Yx(FWY)xxD motif